MPGSLPPSRGSGGVRPLLERIRGQLRQYILLDCLAVTGVALVAWVLLSALFDHGLFRFLGIDLALDAPAFLRTWQKWLVLALVLWLVVPRLYSLLRRKSDVDLALVLEKKHPGVFGESLITSLELADPEKVRASGYSPELVEQAHHQAEEAAKRIDPSSFITWSRLRKRLLGVGLAVAALFPLLTGWTALERRWSPSASGGQRTLMGETLDTLGFWWERTIGGSDTAWPRSVFARLVGFPADGKRKVGKASPFSAQVQAYRYVTAGHPGKPLILELETWLGASGAPPERIQTAVQHLQGTCENGWRPLTWFEAGRLAGDLPAAVAGGLPARAPWLAAKTDAPALLDDLVRVADGVLSGAPAGADADTARAVKAVAGALEQKAASFSLGRRIRVLDLPEKVTLEISENLGRAEGLVTPSKPVSHTLPADANARGQFSHRIPAVPGDLDLRVSALDHHGPTRFLLAISPTPFDSLLVREIRPGYLKRMIDPALEGAARDKALAELAGETEEVDLGDRLGARAEETELVFPAGTALRLKGQLPQDRRWGSARLEWSSAKEQARPVENRLAVQGERDLLLETGKILTPTAFRFALEDADAIAGERKIKLTPVPDEPPTLEVRPSDDLRETDRGFVSTAGGRIPWVGAAGDKQGLGRVYQVHSVRVAREEGVALSVAGSLAMASGPGFSRLLPLGQVGALLYASPVQRAPRRVAALVGGTFPAGPAAALSAPGLVRAALEGMPVERVRLLPGFARQARATGAGKMVHQFALDPDAGTVPPAQGNDFPLAVALEGRGPAEAIEYGRTVVDLRVEAEDLDVVTTAGDGGPGQPHRTATPGVIVRIISDDDMLDLLQGDSLRLRAQIQEARDLLLPADPSIRTPVRHLFELQVLESELRETENRLDPRRRDGDSITRLLEETRGRGREIEQAYLRLLRQTALAGFEVKREQSAVASLLGQLNREMIGALDGAIEQFNRARDANAPASERVGRMRDAGARARDLIRFLDQILDAMGGASDLNREVTRLRGILREQESQARRLETLGKELVNRLLDDLLKP